MSAEHVFSSRMRVERQLRRWSQAEVAAAAGLPHQTSVAKIENRTRPLRLDEAEAIAALFGFTVADMTDADRLPERERMSSGPASAA